MILQKMKIVIVVKYMLNKNNINLHKEEKYKNKFNKINDNLNDSDEYYNLKRSKFNNQVLSSNECSEEEESNNNIKKIEESYYESDSESIRSQSIMNDKDSESINSNIINYKKNEEMNKIFKDKIINIKEKIIIEINKIFQEVCDEDYISDNEEKDDSSKNEDNKKKEIMLLVI